MSSPDVAVCRLRSLRRGARWTVEEDARLLRRMRELEAEGDSRPVVTVAHELGRGAGSVGTRLRAVRAGVEVALHLGSGRRTDLR